MSASAASLTSELVLAATDTSSRPARWATRSSSCVLKTELASAGIVRVPMRRTSGMSSRMSCTSSSYALGVGTPVTLGM